MKPGRWVFVPSEDARRSGKRIKKAVENHWKPPSFYYHLRQGGHVAALRCHEARAFFLRVDIDDFFGRVNRSRVTRCLKGWYPYSEAREMASESVVRRPTSSEFVLPYGFIQSPILASLALDRSKLGAFLRKAHANPALDVSLYMDDIVISSDDESVLDDTAYGLEAASTAAIFPLSTSKRQGPARCVSAFNIDICQGSMLITTARMSAFQSAFSSGSSAAREGIFSYVESINPIQVASL